MSWRENACGLWDRVPRILDPGANEARISDYPFIIPPQFSHYPITIWRRRSESHCVTDSFQTSQPPCKSINYARSPVKSGFQRSSRNASTIVVKIHSPSLNNSSSIILLELLLEVARASLKSVTAAQRLVEARKHASRPQKPQSPLPASPPYRRTKDAFR